MAKRKRTGKGKYGCEKYDWAQIEAYYIASQASLADISKRFGCSPRIAAQHCSERQWVKKREEHCKIVADDSLKAAQEDAIFDKAQFDVMTERTTDLAVALVSDKFTVEYKAFLRGDRSSLDALELKEALASVKIAQDIKYRVLGIAPPKQAIEVAHVQAPSEESYEMVKQLMADTEAATMSGNGEEEPVELAEVNDGEE